MKPLSNQQRLHQVNSEQLYENYRSTQGHWAAYVYGMRWKTIRGKEYLFKDRDRRGNGKSLGARSAETEAVLASFQAGRVVSQERLQLVTEKLQEQARLNKALRLNRVPTVIARVLRELDAAGLHDDFTVIGTQALYAYEAAAGVHFILELLASGDVDMLYDARKKLTVVSEKLDGKGLLGLLKKADRTFECIRENGYRAANAGQFMVDLVVAPSGMYTPAGVTFAKADLVATEVPGLQWLLNSPKLDTVAIDENGWPVPMRVPDPRAFALHKAWLSGQVSREPLKKPRDLDQAKALAQVVEAHLPHLSFKDTLTSLHGDVRQMLPLLKLSI
ncbi:MAG: nucleotidyltransferase domain-containing protein [Rhodoferax sp.]|nr:nucleotidyltransferase domain-containing protein [Rhodoferax sp.]